MKEKTVSPQTVGGGKWSCWWNGGVCILGKCIKYHW